MRVVAVTKSKYRTSNQQTTMRMTAEKIDVPEAAAVAAAVDVLAKPPSPQTNDPQMTKETGGNGGRKKVK